MVLSNFFRIWINSYFLLYFPSNIQASATVQEGSDLESTIAELNGVTESLLATLEGAVARNLLLAQENATLADDNARLAAETVGVINAQLMLAYEELTSGRFCPLGFCLFVLIVF